MEDYTIDIMLGSGTGATSIKMDIPKFTLIGATTKLSSLSSPLRDRFGNVLKLDFYDNSELAKIVSRSFKILGNPLNSEAIAESIAKRSRGTPRIANRFVKMIRDYTIVGHDISTPEAINTIFQSFGIDER
jgi:Holliday junction DNA helicase RuvB